MKKITFILFIILIFTACNDSDIGIFYGIETEEKIVDNSLSNQLTIGGMGKLASSNKMFIAGGKVYTKTAGSSAEWSKRSTPSGYDLTTSLAVADGSVDKVFAVWFNKDSADSALFSTTDGDSWVKVSDPDFSGDFVTVKSANDLIFVSTVTGTNAGAVYYSNADATDFSLFNGINVLGGHFDIDFDGTDYWLLTKEAIYSDSDLTAIAGSSNSPSKDGDEYFRNIYVYDATHIYVTRSYGKFSFYDDTSWDSTIENITPNANDMIVVDINGTETFLAGTNSIGYYEPESPGLSISNLDNPDSDSITCDYNTYKASDLYGAAILSFFDPDDGTGDFYALTYGKGLWKNSLKDGSRRWSWE